MVNLSKFHVVFSSSTLIRLNKDACEGHLCQTVNNFVKQNKSSLLSPLREREVSTPTHQAYICIPYYVGVLWNIEKQLISLSNDLEWSKHIATKTNKANSKLSFLRRNLQGCPEKLKQTAYFSLIHSSMEYGATVSDPYQKYNSDKVERVQRRAARFIKSRYSRYSSVSDMLDALGWKPLSQRRQEARLILFYKIINGLAHVPFEGVLVEAYKGTREKHSMKFRQIGHTTSQYGQSFFSLKLLVNVTGCFR